MRCHHGAGTVIEAKVLLITGGSDLQTAPPAGGVSAFTGEASSSSSPNSMSTPVTTW